MSWSSVNNKWTWDCKSGTRTAQCEVIRKYCGDGIKNGSEACDGESNCTSTCTIIPAPTCGGLNGQVKYSSNGNGNGLTARTAGLCPA